MDIPNLNQWEEMKAYVKFTDADSQRLAEAFSVLSPHFLDIVKHFYDVINEFPGASRVLKNEQQVIRLMRTLEKWLKELFQGPHGQDYFELRRRIGQVHVRVGLDERYMFTAMNVIRTDLIKLVADHYPPGERSEIQLSIIRITDLDLAAMTTSYTETREKARLHALHSEIVQHLPSAVICLDSRARITACTDTTVQIIGPQMRVGNLASEVLPGDLLGGESVPEVIHEMLASETARHFTGISIERGGDTRYLRVTMVPMNHELSRLFIEVADVTEETLAEREARQSESLAQLGALTANLAHEIRNPLAGISSTVQVVVGGLPKQDRRRAALEQVSEQVHRLNHLVTDLLSFGRVTAPKSEETDLAALVLNVINEGGFVAEHMDHRAPMVWADPDCILQILVNLLQNASAAAGPDGRVIVKTGPGPTLDVLDSGSGIEESVQDTLFDAFVTTKARGTGLGLAISQQLADAMDGHIRLVKDEEQLLGGACFRLSLPCA